MSGFACRNVRVGNDVCTIRIRVRGDFLRASGKFLPLMSMLPKLPGHRRLPLSMETERLKGKNVYAA
jgi:hypothetical protein